MRKAVLILIILSQAASIAFAADKNVRQDNPGYYKTPGYIALYGSYVSARESYEHDSAIKPYFTGVVNLIQSEYGNIAVIGGLGWTAPEEKVSKYGAEFKLNSNQFFGDIGLGYFTASKSINFMIGAGYTFSYLRTEMEGLSIGGVSSDYKKKFDSTSRGLYYFVGGEYIFTKSGKWGLVALFNGRELSGSRLEFDDGAGFAGDALANASNWMFSVGLSYHF